MHPQNCVLFVSTFPAPNRPIDKLLTNLNRSGTFARYNTITTTENRSICSPIWWSNEFWTDQWCSDAVSHVEQFCKCKKKKTFFIHLIHFKLQTKDQQWRYSDLCDRVRKDYCITLHFLGPLIPFECNTIHPLINALLYKVFMRGLSPRFVHRKLMNFKSWSLAA